MSQEQVRRSAAGQAEIDREEAARQQAEDDAAVQAAQERPAGDTSDSDELLDEIDALLEENAEEFVRNYVQKGGQ
jgi:ubiquitin-like protein Pup